jgi:hypothetical protein
LRDRPDLEGCAVRCCHCGIRFFTHPRNARRQNLRCPFGCRDHHRRQRANKRSRKHYQTASGRRNKKRLNGKRSQAVSTSPGDGSTPPIPFGNSIPTDALCVNSSGVESVGEPTLREDLELAASSENVALSLDGFVLDEVTLVNSRILPYARMVASVIEGRTVSRDELVATLRKRMRQHSIGRRPRREYVLRYLNQHPP